MYSSIRSSPTFSPTNSSYNIDTIIYFPGCLSGKLLLYFSEMSKNRRFRCFSV